MSLRLLSYVPELACRLALPVYRAWKMKQTLDSFPSYVIYQEREVNPETLAIKTILTRCFNTVQTNGPDWLATFYERINFNEAPSQESITKLVRERFTIVKALPGEKPVTFACSTHSQFFSYIMRKKTERHYIIAVDPTLSANTNKADVIRIARKILDHDGIGHEMSMFHNSIGTSVIGTLAKFSWEVPACLTFPAALVIDQIADRELPKMEQEFAESFVRGCT